uniref:Uncharacterized protein n=1 Tax=viral metagenome TaxID=1070528 RepID=A0A6C0EM18_9ZZZZ
MSRQTELSDQILADTKEGETFTLNDDNLDKAIVDLSLPLETRIEAVNRYCQLFGKDEVIEFLNKLGMMYELSGTRLLRQYLFTICEKSKLNAFLKSIAAKSIHGHDEEDALAYKAVDIIYPNLGPEVGTPYKIEFLKILMKNDEYKEKARNHFCNTINDQEINCDYRYKAILGLEYEEKKKKMLWFIRESCLEFLKCSKNKTMYRILSGQYLLQHCELDKDTTAKVEEVLLNFARDTNNDYNLRADATDVLLQLSTGETKAEAQRIIMELGKTNRTIYENAQNVHSVAIEKSVEEAVEFLHSFSIMKIRGKEIDMPYVEKEIMKLITNKEKEDKIRVAINRIYMDRAIYSRYNCSLANVLLRVWTYIASHKDKDEMKKRMLEELEEMSGTCSSGFITRLINTISGFGDFSMRISWRDQIIANLTGRLNARIRNMDNLTLMEKILEQMTLETDKYAERKHFLKFLRKNILPIREEMYEEFKEHITNTEFDLYFRAAISVYETGKFV